ncbi:MAG: hypothetical protein CMM29_10940 [Rhodospirillaceae bacterium]|mgnify:CR=1 FL=1|nr:hypothetical protein [Rhodospirillaceae bacterium]|tara:strand:+ start:4202 stop:4498 length:297 start_codon:yes stop_codon:yes gene_type:complete
MKGPGDTLSDPSGVFVEYDDEEYEPALALQRSIQMIAVGLSEETLHRIDLDAMEVTTSPHTPEELRALPLWAIRSNIIGEAITQMYEMQDLRRSWAEE